MLKNISNLGTTLSKKEQKNISGGFWGNRYCVKNSDCYGDFLGPGDVFCSSNGFGTFGFCNFY